MANTHQHIFKAKFRANFKVKKDRYKGRHKTDWVTF